MKKDLKNNLLGFLIALILVFFVNGCGAVGSETIEASTGGMEAGTGGVEFTNEVLSPSELGIGDIMYINFDDSGDASVDFSGVDESSEFYLVVGSANESTSGTTMRFSGSLSDSMHADLNKSFIGDEREFDYNPDEILSAWLRALEFDLAENEIPIDTNVESFSKSMTLHKSVAAGDTSSFKVLASLTSTSTYTTVTATAECVEDDVIVYVDNRVTADMLDDDDIDELCASYQRSAEIELALLGEASDVNSDGKVTALLTGAVNELGSMAGGIITGYFYASDLYSGSNSNQQEIVYMMVPDPSGDFGLSISKSFAMNNLLHAVFPHELQHAISYNQHVLVYGGSPEENWLNEGMSHFIEDYVGYGRENYSRYALTLSSTYNTSLVTSSTPDLYERGAAYLFVRYLYEQVTSPESFLSNLVSTSRRGVDNIENAFNGSSGFSEFHEFFARWTIAVAMTNKGITSDARYIYQNRTLDSETGNYHGVCMDCSAEDGRGTILNGVSMSSYSSSLSTSISGSAARYYTMASVPDDSMLISGSSTGSNFGVLIRVE